jgi:hypothetical protein
MPKGWALAVWLALPAGATEPTVDTRPLAEAVQVTDGPCIEQERLVHITASWLGYDAIDRRLEVVVELRGEDALAFALRNEGEVKVEREMPAPQNCADRHAALALAIAMAIDASVLAAALPEPAPAPAPAATPQPPPTDDDAPKLTARTRPAPAPTPRPRVDVFAGALAGFELLPGVAFGGRLGVSVGAARWLDVDVEALAVGGLPFAIDPGEVQPTLAGAAVSVCPARRWNRFQLRLCVAAAGGAVVAEGRNFDESLTATLPWVAGRALADARFRVAKLVWLGIGAGFVAPIVRTKFHTQNQLGARQKVSEVAAAAGIVGIDLAVTIPR